MYLAVIVLLIFMVRSSEITKHFVLNLTILIRLTLYVRNSEEKK